MSDTTENMGTDSAQADPDFQTDFELGQDNIRPFGLDIHNPVFVISAVLISGFVIVSLLNQEAAASFFGWLRPWLTSTFDWFLVLSVNAMLIFCLAKIERCGCEASTRAELIPYVSRSTRSARINTLRAAMPPVPALSQWRP